MLKFKVNERFSFPVEGEILDMSPYMREILTVPEQNEEEITKEKEKDN